jgi:hypothetical protein
MRETIRYLLEALALAIASAVAGCALALILFQSAVH